MGCESGMQASYRPARYAAIDIGTVTCRMLVADVDAQGHLSELDREYAIANLGEGVDATGVLKPQAIQRVVGIVDGYCRVRDGFSDSEHGAIETVAVATSASRDAKNADEFAGALQGIGVKLSVIPGEKEAALSFSGASCDFAGENLMVVDIGGGSTEVVVGRAGQAPVWAHSFNIGCRRVTEKFIHHDVPTQQELDQARAWIHEGMTAQFSELRKTGFELSRLVAVAGTATTVVAVRDKMGVYDSAKVHKARVSRAELDAQFKQLANMPLEQRQSVVGLDPGRAPIIVAGLLIMQTVLDLAGVDGFTVSETDILHGIILDAARIS